MKTSPPINDLREPGIKRVPPGSFLVTGLPRIRSAWLSALFSTESMPCYHEAPTEKMVPISTDAPFGLFDPGAACLYPNWAWSMFQSCTIVIVERPLSDSRRALEKFAGAPADNWKAIEQRYQLFMNLAYETAVRVTFRELADYDMVAGLYSLCTHGQLSRQRFDLFDGLRIEQDVVKRAKAEAA